MKTKTKEPYFITDKGELFITVSKLASFGVALKVIMLGVERFKIHLSTYWEFFPLDGKNDEIYISAKTLPHKILKRIELPNDESSLKDYFTYTDVVDQIAKREERLRYLRAEIEVAVGRWAHFIVHYSNLAIPQNKKITLAKTHSLFARVLELTEQKYSRIELFSAYQEFENLSFNTTNIKSWYSKLHEAKKEGIPETLIHGSLGIERPRLVSRMHRYFIISMLENTNNLSAEQLKVRLNTIFLARGMSELTKSTISNELRKYKNLVSYCRNGEAWAFQNLTPYTEIKKPENPYDMWQMDASRLNFPYIYISRGGSKPKVRFLVLTIVVDCFSNKVAGYALSEKESALAYYQALEMAIRSRGRLPAEIVRDNFKGFNSLAKTLFAQLAMFGVYIRKNKPRRPTGKATVERAFKSFFESYCKPVEGYLGDGVKSKNPLGKPKEEFLDEYKKLKNVRSKAEVESLVTNLIYQYNEGRELNFDSPNMLQSSKEPINSRKLKEHEYPKLFWKMRNTKVSRSAIKFYVHGVKYRYSITDPKLSESLNGRQVVIRFDQDSMETIMVYGKQDDEFICKLELNQKIASARVNQTGFDLSNIQIHQSKRDLILQNYKDQVKEAEGHVGKISPDAETKSSKSEEFEYVDESMPLTKEFDSDEFLGGLYSEEGDLEIIEKSKEETYEI